MDVEDERLADLGDEAQGGTARNLTVREINIHQGEYRE